MRITDKLKPTNKEHDESIIKHQTTKEQSSEADAKTQLKSREVVGKNDGNATSSLVKTLRKLSIKSKSKDEVLPPTELIKQAQLATTTHELEKVLKPLFKFQPQLAIERLSSITNQYVTSLTKFSKEEDKSEFQGAFRKPVDTSILVEALKTVLFDDTEIQKLPKDNTSLHQLLPAVIKTLSYYIAVSKISLDNEDGEQLKKDLTKLATLVLQINLNLPESVNAQGFVTSALGIACILTKTHPFEINKSIEAIDNMMAQKKYMEVLTEAFIKLFPDKN